MIGVSQSSGVVPWQHFVEYAMLLRVPLLACVLLFALPFIAFFTGARSLLRGLFDLTPFSLFVVSLTALSVSGSACATGFIVLAQGSDRFRIHPLPVSTIASDWLCLLVIALVALPVISFSFCYSVYQHAECWRTGTIAAGLRGAGKLIIAYVFSAAAALAIALGVAELLLNNARSVSMHLLAWLSPLAFEAWLQRTNLFRGYADPSIHPDPLIDHLSAAIAFAVVLVLYIATGIWGVLQLGKRATVPALASALMQGLILIWALAAVTFFFDEWRVPSLLIVIVVGLVTSLSKRSDHFYDLRDRTTTTTTPTAAETLLNTGQERVIVVAANGGGIQSSAWAAQVLTGLLNDCGPAFPSALRMLSSVSGGSVGTMYFLYSLASPNTARPAALAACKSSLDEVAWGLAWPDFIRNWFPWLPNSVIGRGRALEKAWCANASVSPAVRSDLDRPLSDWNARVANGGLPGVIMNATVVETGNRLLLSTTHLSEQGLSGRGREDAATLHLIDGHQYDVGVVTAARLSASFPYVTPASRGNSSVVRPHIVDGGYYDNYGMSSLVDWLDEALSGAAGRVKSVLVLQIHGSPVAKQAPKPETIVGLFFQLLAPLLTLGNVRDSGQIAHNDIELKLLQHKWLDQGVAIHSVPFEFDNPETPLSWHLTPQEIAAISDSWNAKMGECRQKVKAFLAGVNGLQCGCPACQQALAQN